MRSYEELKSESERLVASGRDAEAVALLEEAVGEANEALGEAAPRSVNISQLLGRLYRRAGDYPAAIQTLESVLQHLHEALGSHPFVAEAANNLAEAYRESGTGFARARSLYELALDIEPSPVVMSNLGLLFLRLGAFEAAELYARKGLDGRSGDALGLAISRDNLASVLLAQWRRSEDHDSDVQIKEAVELNRYAIDAFRGSGQARSLLRALQNQGAIEIALGHVTEALAAAEEALRLTEQYEPNTDQHAWLLVMLGRSPLRQKRSGDAEALIHLALGMKCKLATATAAYDALSELYVERGQTESAIDAHEKAFDIELRTVLARCSSEWELATSTRRAWRRANQLVACASASPSLELARRCLRAVLLCKGLETDLERRRALIVQEAGDPDLTRIFDELAVLRDERIWTAMRGADGPQISPFYDELTRQEQQTACLIGDMEARMRGSGWGPATVEKLSTWLGTVTPENIAAHLPESALLVEYVRIQQAADSDSTYVALVLNAHCRVELIKLGSASVIDSVVRSEESFVESKTRDILSKGGAIPSHSGEMRRLLMDPVLAAIPECRRLIIVPDAELWRVAFDAFTFDDGRAIIDEYSISLAWSGRNIAEWGQPAGPFTRPLVVGGPDYDLGRAPGLAAFSTFSKLDGAKQECSDIALQLGVSSAIADAATGALVKAAVSPSILHLATHGCFDMDRLDKVKRLQTGMPWEAMASGLIGPEYSRYTQMWEHDPMLRSMLAFTGANRFLQGLDVPAELGTGLLTAAELASVNLNGTELAVLSACHSLRGGTEAGSGVKGLSAALARAGARTAILSLWQVADETTRLLMNDVYRLLLAGEGRAAALHEAKLVQKRRGLPAWQWAAFVCIGDPGPLPSEILRDIHARRGSTCAASPSST